MLRGNEEPISRHVPGFEPELTDGELASYKAAFAPIEREYRQIEKLKHQLDRLTKVRWEQADPKPFRLIETPDGTRWNACAILLDLQSLRGSQILLCHHPERDEWAIIQRLENNGLYAQTHGEAHILMTGSGGPRELVAAYSERAEHTLRFMARNIVAKAQKVIWQQYPDDNPSQVVRAISQRCTLAIENPEAIKETQSERNAVRQSRGIRM